MPKLKQPLEPQKRIAAREKIIADLEQGEMELGQAIRQMRLEWTGLSQGRFGKIAGVSANTISAIERNAEHATVETLNRILKLLGMAVTIRPISLPARSDG